MDGKLMLLCYQCAENLKEIRSVTMHQVSIEKRRCDECGKVRRCDQYIVRRRQQDAGKQDQACL